MKKLLCLFLVFLLAGCAAAYGPEYEQQKLSEAHSRARVALRESQEFSPADYSPHTYQQANRQYERTVDNHKYKPVDELLVDYKQVEVLSCRAALEALRKKQREIKAEQTKPVGRATAAVAGQKTFQDRIAENKTITLEIEENISKVKTEVQGRKIVVRIQAEKLFEVGEIKIDPEALVVLDKLGPILNKYPDRFLQVEGHTDDLPVAAESVVDSNWELSAMRAVDVLKYLVYGLGVEKNRIGAVGYGQFRPLVPNDSAENRARNRRVEIVILPSAEGKGG